MRKILAIGAYERDNFGDYLFLEVLKRALPKDNIIPGSIIYSNMSQKYGIVTLPYDLLLSNIKFDAVWVVGGEVGGVDSYNALRMSLSKKQIQQAEKDGSMQQLAKSKLVNENNLFAYIPNLKIYPINKNTPLIINSVGISHAEDKASLKENIINAVSISVRDENSLSWCKSEDIPAELNPDVVGSVSELYEPSKENQSIIFQANKKYMSKNGITTIANQLKRAWELYPDNEILLIAAGTAPNHDDLDQLEKIAKILNDQKVPATVLEDRSPLKIVDRIASAKIVIATSLHMRIVAASYNIPRISLENDKVTSYVEKWDNAQPSDVKLALITEAIVKATDGNYEWVEEYRKASLESVRKVEKKITSENNNDLTSNNCWFTDLLVKEYESLFSNFSKKTNELSRENEKLRSDLVKSQLERDRLADILDDIKKSKAWKTIEKYRKFTERL